MRKTISSKQLEGMIAQCVGQVIAESKQKKQQKPQSKVLNESQLQEYINNVINEEIEKEGATGYLGGAIKGAIQGVNGLWRKHKLNKQNANSENPKKKIVQNNNTSSFHKLKRTMANQAADSDRNQEFSNLIKKLEKLQLNGYFNSRDDIYQDVDNLIEKLQYFMKYQGGQTKAQYKKNFGVDAPR